MYLTDMLRRLGDRLGIMEMTPASRGRSTTVKIQTRTVTMTELMTSIRITELRELAEMPAELSVPFEEVFAAAWIPSSSNAWTIVQLEEFLNGDVVRGMDRARAQQE